MFSPHEKVSTLLHIERLHKVVSELPTTTPCPACAYDKMGFCKRWKRQIPQEFLAQGCEEFQFNPDSAPF